MTVLAATTLPSDLRIRPLRADDFDVLCDFFRGLSFNSRHQRLMSGRRMEDRELRAMSHLDPQVTTSFIAVTGGTGEEVVLGEARFAREHAGEDEAELAVVVAYQWQRLGLGVRLVAKLIEAGQEQGLTALHGVTFSSNTPMRNLARKLGFRVARQSCRASVAYLRMSLANGGEASDLELQTLPGALEAA